MLSKKMQAALNKQIKMELDSAHIYLSMAAWSADKNLLGFENWMKLQAEEEQEHAMKLYQFLLDTQCKVVLEGIDKPPQDFKSPLELFKASLAHEQKVSKSIHDLYALALEESDYRTQIMLQWFIAEQIEEEAQASEIVGKLESIGDKSSAIYWVDKELKKRGKE
jgi:ferritin